MTRKDQRKWALDYLNDNLEGEYGPQQTHHKEYGLSDLERTSRLEDLTNKLYNTRGYSFNRFERLAVMNVLH